MFPKFGDELNWHQDNTAGYSAQNSTRLSYKEFLPDLGFLERKSEVVRLRRTRLLQRYQFQTRYLSRCHKRLPKYTMFDCRCGKMAITCAHRLARINVESLLRSGKHGNNLHRLASDSQFVGNRGQRKLLVSAGRPNR